MSEVLFQITEENLETGLRGYPVGYCTTSTVDPVKGLSYRGFPVADMAFAEPESVIYLIYYGKQPNDDQLKKFKDELRKRSKCSPEVIQYIQRLPKQGSAMKLFSAALLILGMIEGKRDYREDSLDVIAKIPEIAATVINYHAGWKATNPSRPELGYMENFVQMLNVPNANKDELLKIFKVFNILHYDHGGGNLSAFVGKAVASGMEDLYGSLCASMNALAGPRHGMANQDSLHFVESVLKDVGDKASIDQIETFIRKKLEKRELIFGFGHAVLRVEDPRAVIFYKIAEENYANHALVRTALLLRNAGPKVLKEDSRIANPYPNIDAISGTLLTAAGFPYPVYYTVLFGLARVVGISRQIIYERLEARDGKGTPIVRPKYFYKAT